MELPERHALSARRVRRVRRVRAAFAAFAAFASSAGSCSPSRNTPSRAATRKSSYSAVAWRTGSALRCAATPRAWRARGARAVRARRMSRPSASSSRRCRSARSSAVPARAGLGSLAERQVLRRGRSARPRACGACPRRRTAAPEPPTPARPPGEGAPRRRPPSVPAPAPARGCQRGQSCGHELDAAATCERVVPEWDHEGLAALVWPARPALPAICRYDAGRIGCAPSRITARRAGRFTPAASVVVQPGRAARRPGTPPRWPPSPSRACARGATGHPPASAARAKPSGGAPSAAANSLRVSARARVGDFSRRREARDEKRTGEDALFKRAPQRQRQRLRLFRDGQNARHECPSFADSATSANATRSAAGASAKSVSVSGTPRTRPIEPGGARANARRPRRRARRAARVCSWSRTDAHRATGASRSRLSCATVALMAII